MQISTIELNPSNAYSIFDEWMNYLKSNPNDQVRKELIEESLLAHLDNLEWLSSSKSDPGTEILFFDLLRHAASKKTTVRMIEKLKTCDNFLDFQSFLGPLLSPDRESSLKSDDGTATEFLFSMLKSKSFLKQIRLDSESISQLPLDEQSRAKFNAGNAEYKLIFVLGVSGRLAEVGEFEDLCLDFCRRKLAKDPYLPKSRIDKVLAIIGTKNSIEFLNNEYITEAYLVSERRFLTDEYCLKNPKVANLTEKSLERLFEGRDKAIKDITARLKEHNSKIQDIPVRKLDNKAIQLVLK